MSEQDEMPSNVDIITEPQEWIDGLLSEYAPNSEDIDVALQNMGLRIMELEAKAKQDKLDLLDRIEREYDNEYMGQAQGKLYRDIIKDLKQEIEGE